MQKKKRQKNTNKWIIRKKKSPQSLFFFLFFFIYQPNPLGKSLHIRINKKNNSEFRKYIKIPPSERNNSKLLGKEEEILFKKEYYRIEKSWFRFTAAREREREREKKKEIEKRNRERNEKGISVAWARSSLILPIQVLFSASDGALGTRIHHSPAFFVRLSLRSCRIYKAASQPTHTHIENGKRRRGKRIWEECVFVV